MPIGSDALTDSLPRLSDTQFFVAPQTDPDAPAIVGFQALHFTEYAPVRQQSAEASTEYGGAEAGDVDPTDPEPGDADFSGNLSVRLCLNEIGFWLAYLLGAPTSTDAGGGRHTHVFTSGSARLPLATIRDSTAIQTRTADAVALGGMSVELSRGGGIQTAGMPLSMKGLDVGPRVTTSTATYTDAPTRLLVPKNNWVTRIGGTQVGRVLGAALDYSTDLQTERYVEATDRVGGLFVGDPTLGLRLNLRAVSEAQRAVFGGFEDPLDIELEGTRPDGTGIVFHAPRVLGPVVFPSADDRLQALNFEGQAARTDGDTPAPMLTVTLTNTVAAY